MESRPRPPTIMADGRRAIERKTADEAERGGRIWDLALALRAPSKSLLSAAGTTRRQNYVEAEPKQMVELVGLGEATLRPPWQTYCPIFENARVIWMPAGVRRMIRIEGKIRKASGRIILTGASRAFSSARCLRLTRSCSD